jgi:hypothetical protein
MLLGALVTGACTGNLTGLRTVPSGGAGSPAAGVGGGASSAGMTGGGTAGTTGGTMGGAAGVAIDGPGRSLIRRLSNAEYDATVATLMGDPTPRSSAFPPDTAVHGFMNNSDVQDVSPALGEQYLSAAEAIAAKATQTAAGTDTLLGCKLAAGETCLVDFIARFGKRAWRRPLDATEQADLLGVFRAGRDKFDATTGVQLVIEALLTSPTFLYRAEVGRPVDGKTYNALTSWEMASRLSYFLTGTMPDDRLMQLADADGLTTPDSVAAEARRLLATPAARQQTAEFFAGWLDLRATARLQRDTAQFPKWDSRYTGLFSDETRAFVKSVVFDGAGDFQTLMTAPFTYGAPELAAFYGGTAGPATAGVARIDLPPAQRAGLLTQASFLAIHAKEIQTDPVARGKFIRERVLCQGIAPPPPDIVITPPVITPGSTTRQRFTQHESVAACAACHRLLDPVGLAFENYDAIGQWRDQEQGLAIDSSGNLTGTDVEGPFNGVVAMAAKLSGSKTAASCFVRQWFRFAFGKAEVVDDDPRIDALASTFQQNKNKVIELMVALTATPDFRYLARTP